MQFFLIVGVKKLGKHRSRLQILENILSVINDNEGVKKTQIMYQAYLSYQLLIRYLNDVLISGLAVCDSDNCYRLTLKGEKFLTKFNKYSRFRENVDEQVNHVEDQKMMLEEMCPSSGIENASKKTVERDRA